MTNKKELLEKQLSFSNKERELYTDCYNKLQKAVDSMEQNYLETAFALYPIYKHELYKLAGYKNIAQFASALFGISKSTCYNGISICDEFGVIENGQVKSLHSKFKKYSTSQLCVLLTVPQDKRSRFKPEMSVAQMKQLKRMLESPLLNFKPDSKKNTELPLVDTPSSQKEVEKNSSMDDTFSTYNKTFLSFEDLSNYEECIRTEFENYQKEHPEKKAQIKIIFVSND